ncbi:hypothetical protein VTN96DRAFT_2592 [Rasamsonia emersonii]
MPLWLLETPVVGVSNPSLSFADAGTILKAGRVRGPDQSARPSAAFASPRSNPEAHRGFASQTPTFELLLSNDWPTFTTSTSHRDHLTLFLSSNDQSPRCATCTIRSHLNRICLFHR